MTATEMVKKIGMRGTYKVGRFILDVEINDLQDISGEGTMCLVTARGVSGQSWVPLWLVKSENYYNEDKENDNENRKSKTR